MALKKPQPAPLSSVTDEALDLALAPMPAQPPSEDDEAARKLSAALNRAEAAGELNLTVIADAELSGADVAYFARLNRVVSYLRLWHFLRRTPGSFKEEEAQAAMALGYLRFSETDAGMKALLAGRSRGDEMLEVQIDRMKLRLTTITEQKIQQGIAQGSNQGGSNGR